MRLNHNLGRLNIFRLEQVEQEQLLRERIRKLLLADFPEPLMAQQSNLLKQDCHLLHCWVGI